MQSDFIYTIPFALFLIFSIPFFGFLLIKLLKYILRSNYQI